MAVILGASFHLDYAFTQIACADDDAYREAQQVGVLEFYASRLGPVVIHGVSAPELAEEVRKHVSTKLGPIARPRAVFLVPDLPKTRSGKIMRRLLRDVAEGRELGDATTLADSSVVDEIRARASESPQED